MALLTVFLDTPNGGKCKIEGDELALEYLNLPMQPLKTCRRCGSYYQDRRVELVDAGKPNLGCCGNHGSM